MCDTSRNFRRKTEYLDACYESWKGVLDKFDSLLKSLRSLSPNPGEALQRLIDDAKSKLTAKRDELERLYDSNIELLRKGVELHDTVPIVIRLEVNWSQIVRTAWATADATGNISTPNSDMAIPFCVEPLTRSQSNSPCLFGSIGSGLAVSSNATSGFQSRTGTSSVLSGANNNIPPCNGVQNEVINGTSSAEPFLHCLGQNDQLSSSLLNDNKSGSRINGGGGFDSSWLPGWTGLDFALQQKQQEQQNGSSILNDILNSHNLFNNSTSNHSSNIIGEPILGSSAPHDAKSTLSAPISPPPSFSSIVSSENDRTACFEWLFNCLKDWRSKMLLSVPLTLLYDHCSAYAEQRFWKVLGGENIENLIHFLSLFPGVFNVNLDSMATSLVLTAPSADAKDESEPSEAFPSSNMISSPSNHRIPLTPQMSLPNGTGSGSKTTPIMPEKQRRGSLLELDDFGNTSNSSHSSTCSNSLTSDDGMWQEVVKKVQKNNAGKPNLPCATDIRERIIELLDLVSHGPNLSKLIAVEILRRAVKENAVPRDLSEESIEKLRTYLPNAISSARGKLARPKPNLPPEHADWTYKTKLCVQFATTRQCTMAAQCRFAHGLSELRPKRRAEYCSYWKKTGSCPRRDSCQYAHSAEELGQFVDPLTSSSSSLKETPSGFSSSIGLSLNQNDSGSEDSNCTGSVEACWLCKGQRRGVASKQLQCGHKFHTHCLNK